MSPAASSFHGFQEHPKKTIKGPRPSPLMINKESHSIKKQVVKKPIIIYMHSPKVIHTKAQDFMSLVQKLTGMPRPDGGATTESDESGVSSVVKEKRGCEGSEITSRGVKGIGDGVNREVGYGVAADMPLFTPNSSDFLSPSRSVYKYFDSPFGILGSLISPSGLEFIKELPEY